MTATFAAIDFAMAWTACQRLLRPGWELQLTYLNGGNGGYSAAARWGGSLASYRMEHGRARYCPFESAYDKDPVVALEKLAGLLRAWEQGWLTW